MGYRETVPNRGEPFSKLVRWGPGRKYIKRVWVDPYERGPEDAPRKPRKPEVGVVK